MSEKRTVYDIIIPVYGALPYLRQCINSVLENTKHPYNLVIIDDGNNPIIKEYLRTVELARIITNKKNSGWLKSCNIGIENTENDVVLLNSDTLVTEGWLEKMDRCAYSNSRIGMVNPLTNAAAFLSVPYPYVFNTIPPGFTLKSFSELIAKSSELRYPSIPTVHGFCLLIKRKVITRVGLFDEKYDRGYGEEDDFCWRAKRMGYRMACDDDAFVYHYKNKSFGNSFAMDVYRIRNAKKFLHDWGSKYWNSIKKFNKENPLSYLQSKLLMKISENSPEYENKVSIIMPVWNREKYLEGTIRSILEQTYSNFELVIVDDASTDNSLNIIREFAAGDKRITVISLPEHRGCGVVRNEGLKVARGGFVTFMDSDDIMLPNAIGSRVEFLNSHQEIDLVFGEIDKFIDGEGCPIENCYFQEVRQFYEMQKNYDFYEKLKRLEQCVPGAVVTSMFRRDILFKAGFYEENLSLASDTEFFFRVIRNSNPSYIAQPIISYRMHDDSLSGKVDRATGEWVDRPENTVELSYLNAVWNQYRVEFVKPRRTHRKIKFLNSKRKENSMERIEKGELSMNLNQKFATEESDANDQHSQVELLMDQIAHMAEQIDQLRSKIRNQHLSIVAKDQHINELNRAIIGKDQHIANLEKMIRERDAGHYQNLMNLTKEIIQIKKYSVFYNLLSRFRKELLKLVGKVGK